MTNVRKPRKKSQKQLLVEALIEPTQILKINWGKEMKTLGFILNKFPDVDFWLHHSQKSKYASLIHLLNYVNNTTEIQSEYLSYTKNNKFELKVAESPIMQHEKVGNDTIIEKKAESLFDFVNS